MTSLLAFWRDLASSLLATCPAFPARTAGFAVANHSDEGGICFSSASSLPTSDSWLRAPFLANYLSLWPRFCVRPRRMASRFLGASGDRKSGMVFFVRRGRKIRDWPFRYPSFLYISVPAWSWFRDVFFLQDQREWFFSAGGFLRKPESIRVGCERVVVIVAILFVRRASLWVAPHAIFQDSIPDEPSTGITETGVLADSGRIDCPGELSSCLHGDV